MQHRGDVSMATVYRSPNTSHKRAKAAMAPKQELVPEEYLGGAVEAAPDVGVLSPFAQGIG